MFCVSCSKVYKQTLSTEVSTKWTKLSNPTSSLVRLFSQRKQIISSNSYGVKTQDHVSFNTSQSKNQQYSATPKRWMSIWSKSKYSEFLWASASIQALSQGQTRKHSGQSNNPDDSTKTSQPENSASEPKENIYTIPNLLTVGRFIVAPYLGYMVLQENFHTGCVLLGIAALTDMADGYIARNWKGQSSILGSVIDPLADKFLVFNLVISLTLVQLIPVWLTALYLARDTYLVLSGFRVRYITLSPPRTFKRYWDLSHPTAVVKPSTISKVNTNLQLVLLTATCAAPVFGYVDHIILQSLWGVTGVTTVWSFIDYIRNVPYTAIDQTNGEGSKKDKPSEK